VKRTSYLCHVLLLVVFAFSAGSLPGQDIHFSQFSNSPLNLSPGLNGVFGGDMRFIGNYRNQWRSVPVPYNTFSGTIENKFYYRKEKYDRYFTGSLLLNYDRQGSLKLTSLQIGIPIGITIPLAPGNFLSVSATPAFGQRSFDSHNWSFDAQFVDCLYDPGNPTREDGSLFSTNLQYFDLAAGLNYHWQSQEKRSKLDIGGGMHHLNRPDHNFWTNNPDDDVRLASRVALYGLGMIQLTSSFDLALQAQYQQQGGYRELLYGAGARFLLNSKPYEELALQVGAYFRQRYSDAVIWHAEVYWKTWTLGFSYDINVSDFNIATNNRGGPEVSLSYRLYRFKPTKYCPIDY